METQRGSVRVGMRGVLARAARAIGVTLAMLAATLPLTVEHVQAAPTAELAITLSNDGSCAPVGANTINFVRGELITVCYRLTNTSALQLQVSTLESATFGEILEGEPTVLDSGETFEHTEEFWPTETTSEQAIWSPMDQGGNVYEVESSAQLSMTACGDVYVDQSAGGAANGLSWADAFTDLQSALACGMSGTIHIAEGNYAPDSSDRLVPFGLVDDLDLIGGYPVGGGVSDPSLYKTRLTGDLQGNDVAGDPATTTDNSTRVVEVGGTVDVAVRSLTITSGRADIPLGGRTSGAGVYIFGRVEFERVVISDNEAQVNGAGIYSLGDLVLVDAEVSGNTAGAIGGGVAVQGAGSLSVSHTVFTGNTASGGGAVNIGTSQPASIVDSVFSANTSLTNSGGGALRAGGVSGDLEVIRTQFSDNEATLGGGALLRGATRIIDSSFSHNTAGFGGAVYVVDNSSAKLLSSTVDDNVASSQGGGILNRGNLEVINSLVVDNTASLGGAIFTISEATVLNATLVGNEASTSGGAIRSTSNSDPLTVLNSILWGNTAPTDPELSAMVVTVSDSIVQGGFTGSGILTTNPQFVDPVGGDYQLGGGSPAVNAADSQALLADDHDLDNDGDTTEPTPDRNLHSRVFGPEVDMGAFERQSLPTCNGLPATILWTAGAVATSGDDVIVGTNDADDIDGEGGNDTICALGGGDMVHGGAGDDTIYGGEGDDEIHGDEDNDFVRGGNGGDTIHGHGGDDDLAGQGDDDIIFGGVGEDALRGGDGADELRGGDDDDFLSGQDGADDMWGDGGEDRMRGGNGVDTMYGGDDKDFMQGGEGDDFLYGEGGNDRVSGNNGNDTIEGGDQPDRVYGGAGNDVIDGGAANDILNGQGDDDIINGGANNDIINGGTGDDELRGDQGDDEVRGQDGDDELFGGLGDDDVLLGGDGADEHDGGSGTNDRCNGAIDTDLDTAVDCEIIQNMP